MILAAENGLPVDMTNVIVFTFNLQRTFALIFTHFDETWIILIHLSN